MSNKVQDWAGEEEGRRKRRKGKGRKWSEVLEEREEKEEGEKEEGEKKEEEKEGGEKEEGENEEGEKEEAEGGFRRQRRGKGGRMKGVLFDGIDISACLRNCRVMVNSGYIYSATII